MAGNKRIAARFHLLACVDVLTADNPEPVWGGVGNVCRTGLALYVRQPLKPGGTATLRFRFQAEGGGEIIEELVAKIVWQRGETAGLEFEDALQPGSPAAQKAPQLADYLAKKEAPAMWPM